MKNSSPTLLLRHKYNCPYCETMLKKGDNILAPQKQRHYLEEIENYALIREARALVICNKDRVLDPRDCLDILYAIDQNKTIILLCSPTFSKKTSLFAQDIIIAKLNKILLLDISILDKNDYAQIINNIGPDGINYTLTKHQKTLIRSMHKSLFRSLEGVRP
jgi:hypothetical protein